MSITFSSCFYIIKSKFDPNVYISWMNNFLSIVNNFNLVIYSDDNSAQYIDTKGNPKIKIVIKPIDQFYNYKYETFWIENHKRNYLLNDKSNWVLNMLWSEKIWFVKETIERKYFETNFYGWCDIGYFRNRPEDTHSSQLLNWPNMSKINALNKNKICYACINNDDRYMNYLYKLVNNNKEIPATQNSIAGGFFILHKDKINWWAEIYNAKLESYFKNNSLVKDDQIILVDCILSNMNEFILFREKDPNYDNWFMFQRIFL
jgi:hypothetical protein